jgi:hypothetical protein
MNAADKALEARIIELDKQGWEAWKANDATWFKHNTTEGFVSISSAGISNKAEVIKSTPSDCKVTAYSLSDFTFVMLDMNLLVRRLTGRDFARPARPARRSPGPFARNDNDRTAFLRG